MVEKDKNTKPTYIHYYCSWFKSKKHVKRLTLLFEAMAAKGWKCILVLAKKPKEGSWQDILKSLDLTIIYHPRPIKHFDFKCICRVRDLCKKYNCGLFRCDNMHTSPLIGAFLAGVKVRIWYKRSMNSDFELCKPKRNIKDKIAFTTRLSCLLSTSVIAVSSLVKKELVDMGIQSHKVFVNNNPKPLPVQLADRKIARRKFGYSEDTIVALSIGHAVPVKGWSILLEAFQKISTELPDLSLLLVGSTISNDEITYYEKISEYINSNSLQGRIQFTGHLNSLEEVLAVSDLFVLPSLSEGSCYALIEAMDAKLPCISTAVGIAEDLIKNNKNGFVIERNNTAALSDKLLKLASNKNLLIKFRNNISIPDDFLSTEKHAEKTASLFDSFWNKKSNKC